MCGMLFTVGDVWWKMDWWKTGKWTLSSSSKNKKNLQFTAMLQSFGPLTMSKCFMSAMCYWLLWGPLCEQQGVPAAVRACMHLIVLLWSGGVFTAVRYECLCKTSALVFKADNQSRLSAPPAPPRDVGAPEMITSHSRKFNKLSKPGRPPSLLQSTWAPHTERKTP